MNLRVPTLLHTVGGPILILWTGWSALCRRTRLNATVNIEVRPRRPTTLPGGRIGQLPGPTDRHGAYYRRFVEATVSSRECFCTYCFHLLVQIV
jgi:hypothetical protein